jgi:Zn-dependent metalloprotease
MKIRTQTLAILFLLTVLSSCQKPPVFQSVSWQTGEPKRNLQAITEIETTPQSTEIIFGNERIQYKQQVFKDQPIENTFIKKVYSSDSQLKVAEAVYVNESDLEDRKLKPQKPQTEKLIEILKSTIQSLKIQNYQVQNVIRLYQGQLRHFQVVQYEIADGTLWKSYFNNQNKLILSEILGSHLSDMQTQVYTTGPKQSSLTEVLLQGLVAKPSISNSKIYVDTESPHKILEILPELKFDPKDERFDQVQVFYYLNFIQDWIKNNLAVRFPQKLEAVVNVGYPEKTNTAFYFQNKIRLGRGDDVDYSLIASDPSIVYHETFHALVDGLAHLPFDKEGGSINEAFADFFTCVALNRPYLGEASYLKAPYRRTIQSSIKLDEKSGGLYHDSQIISSLLWEIKEKLGTEKSLKIAVETLARLNPGSDFDDFNSQLLRVIHPDDQATASEILTRRGFQNE